MPGFINPYKARFFEGSFFWRVSISLSPPPPPPHPLIFQEELIQCQYNFIPLLNNLFKIGWR